VIDVRGLDSSGDVVAHGRSAPFRLEAEEPRSVELFFARVNRFSVISAALGQARYGHTATLLDDGRVVIAGGQDEQGMLSSVEIYDPATNTFSEAEPLRKPRAFHRVVRVGQSLVFVGGLGPQPLASVEVYELPSGTVRELQLSNEREGHTASLLPNGKVLVFGGRDGRGKGVEDTEIVDPKAGQVTTVARTDFKSADHVAIVLGDGRVVLAGGVKTPPGQAEDRSVIFDASAALPWSAGPDLPTALRRATVSPLGGGRFLVAGGAVGASASDQALVFDGQRFASAASRMEVAHLGHASAATSVGVMVAGGDTTQQVELFRADRFEDGGQLLGNRADFTLTTLSDGSVLAVGGRDGTAARGDAERFVPFSP